MSTTTDGGLAFLVSDSPGYNFDTRSDMNGIFVRDYFAAKAMQGLLSGPIAALGDRKLVPLCYEIADAMIKARSQT